MIFQSKLFSATWDTWMYWHEDTFYLYYLITEHSPGEGVGVATSKDGVHFTDHGKVIAASDDMVFYLGTGSVWKSPGFEKDGLFLCNYSEWRQVDGDLRQTIFFAWSKDLLRWEKLGDACKFLPDGAYYREFQSEGSRWDCIFPLQQKSGAYYGYWTAAPKDFVGVGFGESRDGIHWNALPPPKIELGPFAAEREVEAGAVCCHEGLYYLMAGCYSHEAGVGCYVAEAPEGPFYPMKKSFALFSNKTHIHAYFPRFVRFKEELLVNFHGIAREENGQGRFYTALSPLKKVVFEDKILRLKWWENNDRLVGEQIENPAEYCMLVGIMPRESNLELNLKDKSILRILIEENGVVSYQISTSGTFQLEEAYQKDLPLPEQVEVRLLLGNTLTELYLDNYFIASYTLPSPLLSVCCGTAKLNSYRMTVDR